MNQTLRFPLLLLCVCVGAAVPAQEGQSTFGHARARELAELGRLPTPRDVVVRDVVNFHRHRLPLPKVDQDVALDVRFDRNAPDERGRIVLQVGYTTRPAGDRALCPPCSVALVVDCSGSMHDRGKMDQVKVGLREFVRNLRSDDEVALVAFEDEARVVAARRAKGDGRWLQDAVDSLQPGGSTNLHAGLMLGLRELPTDDFGDRARRVVLLTDGIANRGVTAPAEILADVRRFSADRIDISTIGVGENLDVALLERLAEGTRGLFHFVADEQQVQKVFHAEIDSLLQPAVRRPRLEIELPEGLAVEQSYDESVRQRGDRLFVELRDLNAGATGVVLVACRVGRDGPRTLPVRAELRYDTAAGDHRGAVSAEATLRTEDRAAPQVDLEVRKNHAIAVLAQGLREMATASEQKRWADADRALRLARDESQRLFPGDDPDLQRVRDIAAGHARTLQRYVDRFRDN